MKARRLRDLSRAYLEWDGIDPRVLPGVGQYAYDAWKIFVWNERPEWVDDGPLNLYLARECAG